MAIGECAILQLVGKETVFPGVDAVKDSPYRRKFVDFQLPVDN
jgi:hypothetical protein